MKKLLALSLLAFLSAGVYADTEQQGLTIGNFKDYERITYPVPLIRGTYTCPRKHYNKLEEAPEVFVKNETTGRTIKGTGLSRRYKVWPELVYGTNTLTVTVKTKERTESNQIRLIYEKPNTDYLCYVYYMVDKNGDHIYISNLDKENDPQYRDNELWKKKFTTGLKLMQSFTGDSMYRLGYPRRCFAFNCDEKGEIIINVITSQYTKAEVCAWKRKDGSFDEGKLYENFCEVLGEDRKGGEFRRVFGIPNMASFVDGKVSGNTALGGPLLGQFGATGLYAWPASLDEVVQCFTNNTPITTTLNDSCWRDVQYGQCATTLGAYMHEGGHGFGLPHIEGDKYNSVMARSYDIMNRCFTSWETPTKRTPEVTFFEERDEPVWSRIESHILSSVPFFNEYKGSVPRTPPTYKLDDDGDTIRVHDDDGLVLVSYWGLKYKVLDTPNCHMYPLDGSVKDATLSLKQMRAAMQTEEKFEMKFWDKYGNQASPVITKEGKPSHFWD